MCRQSKQQHNSSRSDLQLQLGWCRMIVVGSIHYPSGMMVSDESDNYPEVMLLPAVSRWWLSWLLALAKSKACSQNCGNRKNQGRINTQKSRLAIFLSYPIMKTNPFEVPSFGRTAVPPISELFKRFETAVEKIRKWTKTNKSGFTTLFSSLWMKKTKFWTLAASLCAVRVRSLENKRLLNFWALAEPVSAGLDSEV